jgi:hypothetical protein
MALHIILAVLFILLAILFIYWSDKQSYNNFFVGLGGLRNVFNLFFAGFPLSLFFFLFVYFTSKIILLKEIPEKTTLFTLKILCIIQWLIWSQIIAFLLNIYQFKIRVI